MATTPALVLEHQHQVHQMIVMASVLGVLLVLAVLVVTVILPLASIRGDARLAVLLDDLEQREARAWLALVKLRERGHLGMAARLEAGLNEEALFDATYTAQHRVSELIVAVHDGCPELAERLRQAYGLTGQEPSSWSGDSVVRFTA